ncbi:MAG: tRNA (5-methylaminomethyl-2-thiouridine)(34)-methyltransferase MnmD [Vicingaceae bacterium]
MDKRELKITADGSHTLFIPELDETYHSTHGAIQEAKHVFIEAGLNYIDEKKLNILEIGFGTGLNAFLTMLEANRMKLKVNYFSLEAFPLDIEIINQLNYNKELSSKAKEIQLFNKLHFVAWERLEEITTNFSLKKQKIALAEFIPNEKFDLIFFDAFGPRVQPEMWTKEIFENMYNSLNENGVLVTYCAKGSVKRTIKEVGFKLESIPGPPGKREMSRAIKL